ncbi:MAG: peptide chain release factor 1 [Oscillospiraceae bacterium]|jgi:peptide chain release factor 1|nr:peptide chain release factor 1 [Oscillospiraceae bacterium]
MLDKLKQIEQRYIELETRLSDGDVYSDPSAMAKLMKEQKELYPYAQAARDIEKCLERESEALTLIDGRDPEMRELAREELSEVRGELERLYAEAKILLLPKDPNDDKNVILEIRGGAGGEEAALFAAALLRMYTMYAERNRWKFEIMSVNETELGGIKEVSALIEGRGAYARLKYESGVHRVQRVPDTEASGRIHTSTVTVAVLPEAEEVDIEINPADLKVDTYRAGGAGGQHVNKTDSAVRITHMPTGVVVECQDERSQHKNRDRAMKILRSKLLEAKTIEQEQALAKERKSQVGTGDRNERIRTYNFPQGRMSDHRINLTLYKLGAIIDGDLDETVDALASAAQAEQLTVNSE